MWGKLQFFDWNPIKKDNIVGILRLSESICMFSVDKLFRWLQVISDLP